MLKQRLLFGLIVCLLLGNIHQLLAENKPGARNPEQGTVSLKLRQNMPFSRTTGCLIMYQAKVLKVYANYTPLVLREGQIIEFSNRLSREFYKCAKERRTPLPLKITDTDFDITLRTDSKSSVNQPGLILLEQTNLP